MVGGKDAKFRTRFPVSRIKKIMQADEAVGKIAQNTPAVVSRAVELFLEGLLTAAIAASDDATPGRITPGALKRLVSGSEEYDFLRALFENVPDDKGDKPATLRRGRPSKAGASSETIAESIDQIADAVSSSITSTATATLSAENLHSSAPNSEHAGGEKRAAATESDRNVRHCPEQSTHG